MQSWDTFLFFLVNVWSDWCCRQIVLREHYGCSPPETEVRILEAKKLIRGKTSSSPQLFLLPRKTVPYKDCP